MQTRTLDVACMLREHKSKMTPARHPKQRFFQCICYQDGRHLESLTPRRHLGGISKSDLRNVDHSSLKCKIFINILVSILFLRGRSQSTANYEVRCSPASSTERLTRQGPSYETVRTPTDNLLGKNRRHITYTIYETVRNRTSRPQCPRYAWAGSMCSGA